MADIESEQDIFDSTGADSADEGGKSPQPRDEGGRFASQRQDEPEQDREEPQPIAEQPNDQEPRNPNRVPVAEIQAERQKRQQFERDFQQEREARIRLEAQLQAFMSRQAPQQRQQEPQPPPDIFENPNGFVQHGIQQALSPIENQMMQQREFYSQRDAVREHGIETVREARADLERRMASHDPSAWQVYQRAMNSFDPYGEIVGAYKQNQTLAQVGNDPNAWFEKKLAETAGDPAGREKLLSLLNGGQVQQLQSRGAPLINLPSVNRASGGNPRTTNGPASEEDIYSAAPTRMGRKG